MSSGFVLRSDGTTAKSDVCANTLGIRDLGSLEFLMFVTLPPWLVKEIKNLSQALARNRPSGREDPPMVPTGDGVYRSHAGEQSSAARIFAPSRGLFA